MNRLEETITVLRGRREKALALFLTAGFPKLSSTVSLVLELEKAGADIIELGMPFSDPLADGPVIQHSSGVALKNGMTLARILSDVKAIRKHSTIPIVLMGYLNPIMQFGMDKFFARAAWAGVDGVILPEIPLEESSRVKAVLAKNKLAQIMLVTPTSSAGRIRMIDAASGGFLYCVSMTGVTGIKRKEAGTAYIKRVKRNAKRNPVLVGFGISSPKEARTFSRHSDGVIVGSALLKRIDGNESIEKSMEWVKQIKESLDRPARF